MRQLEYAQRLAQTIRNKFYPEAIDFVVSDDFFIVIDQIDNMISGLRRKETGG